MNKEIAIKLLNELREDGVHVYIGLNSGRELALSCIAEVSQKCDIIIIEDECEGTFFVPASSIEFIHV